MPKTTKTTKETQVPKTFRSEADRQAAHRKGVQTRIRSGARPKGFDPCVNMPATTRNRFRGAIKACHRQPSAAIRLFCMECMGYSLPDARGCDTKTCPLWALSRRYFKENGDDAEFGEQKPA